MKVRSVRAYDKFGRAVTLPTAPPGVSLDDYVQALIKAEPTALPQRKSTLATGGTVTTDDVCFDGTSAAVQAFLCFAQDTTLDVEWYLDPQPPDGTAVTYSDSGVPSSIESSGSLSPQSQSSGPYETEQKIAFIPNAMPAMDYLDTVSSACSNPSETVTCTPGTAGVGIVCNLTESNCPNAQIYDDNQQTVVANPTPVGQPSTSPGIQQNLEAKLVANGQFSVKSNYWKLPVQQPPSVVAGFQFSDSTAGAVDVNSITNPTVQYYWTNGQSGQVQEQTVALRSDGQELTLPIATANYTLESPPVVLTVNPRQMNVWRSATPPFGYTLSLAEYQPGMLMAYTIAGRMATDFGGQIGMTQLIQLEKDIQPSTATGVNTSDPALGLDGCAMFPDGYENPSTGVNDVQLVTVKTYGNGAAVFGPNYYDSPGFDLTPNMSSATMNGQIEDYLMFRPTSSFPTIWVSLGNVDFFFGATAVQAADGSFWLDKTRAETDPAYAYVSSSTDPSLPNYKYAENTYGGQCAPVSP